METAELQCPFCWETFSITLAPEDGEEQNFVYDCEVCCNPINVDATYDEDKEWTIVAAKGEGFD